MPSYSPRILELRRRVQSDPAPVVFAQLAEEYRRAGNHKEAVKCCRDSLARHPGYLSARVILGRALTELGLLDEAAHEFEVVLESAPGNLAATRDLAEIHQRRGGLETALEYFKRALALAPTDAALRDTVGRLARQLGTTATPTNATRLTTGGKQPQDVQPAVDLDGLLVKLGAPEHSPPPLMDMLLTEPVRTEGVLDPELTHAPLCDPQPDESFAALERELRSYERTTNAPTTEDPSALVLAELESWLSALQSESNEDPPV